MPVSVSSLLRLGDSSTDRMRAEREGLQQLFLYDPRGWLQRRARLLEKQCDLVGATQRPTGEAAFHVGWPQLWTAASHSTAADHRQEQQQQGQRQGQESRIEHRAAFSQRRRPPWPLSEARTEAREQQPSLQVVLLSAVDAHWPLVQAVHSARGSADLPGLLGEGGQARMPISGVAAGAAGLTPAARARQYGYANGSMKEPAPTRASAAPHGIQQRQEDVPSGCPGAQTVKGWMDLKAQQQHVPLPPWPQSQAFGSLGLLHSGSDCGSNCHSSSGSAHGAVSGDQLESAIAAPARLRERLGEAAGSLASAELDLLLVFGEAFTLAGYPPWAVRTSEIYHMGLLQQLRWQDLQRVLQRYLGTKQRFGT
ncbi:hypothetical protein N2152v2_011305 [Parachlorella kessleri]